MSLKTLPISEPFPTKDSDPELLKEITLYDLVHGELSVQQRKILRDLSLPASKEITDYHRDEAVIHGLVTVASTVGNVKVMSQLKADRDIFAYRFNCEEVVNATRYGTLETFLQAVRECGRVCDGGPDFVMVDRLVRGHIADRKVRKILEENPYAHVSATRFYSGLFRDPDNWLEVPIVVFERLITLEEFEEEDRRRLRGMESDGEDVAQLLAHLRWAYPRYHRFGDRPPTLEHSEHI